MDAKFHGDSQQYCGEITETHTNVVEKSNPDLNTHILHIFSTTMLILLKQALHSTIQNVLLFCENTHKNLSNNILQKHIN